MKGQEKAKETFSQKEHDLYWANVEKKDWVLSRVSTAPSGRTTIELTKKGMGSMQCGIVDVYIIKGKLFVNLPEGTEIKEIKFLAFN